MGKTTEKINFLRNKIFCLAKNIIIFISNLIANSLILMLKGYKYIISPLLGNCCRFYPSCSSYACEAINSHGCLRGSYLTFKRILRCHPWHPGGIDPIPEQSKK